MRSVRTETEETTVVVQTTWRHREGWGGSQGCRGCCASPRTSLVATAGIGCQSGASAADDSLACKRSASLFRVDGHAGSDAGAGGGGETEVVGGAAGRRNGVCRADAGFGGVTRRVEEEEDAVEEAASGGESDGEVRACETCCCWCACWWFARWFASHLRRSAAMTSARVGFVAGTAGGAGAAVLARLLVDDAGSLGADALEASLGVLARLSPWAAPSDGGGDSGEYGGGPLSACDADWSAKTWACCW